MSAIKLSTPSSGSISLSPANTASNLTITVPAITDTMTTTTTKIISGTAVASTSGTSIDFTGIPSWAKRVTVMLQGVSTNGTSNIQLQIGAGSVTVSGYVSNSFGSNATTLLGTVGSTTGFIAVSANGAAATLSGVFTINLLNASTNTYVYTGSAGRGDTTQQYVSSGSISLNGTLDRVRITTVNGTDAFDAGTINILYE